MLPVYTKTKERVSGPKTKKLEGRTTLAQAVMYYWPRPSVVVIAEENFCQVVNFISAGWGPGAHGHLVVVE